MDEPEENKSVGICHHCGAEFIKQNNHQRRFCNQDHAIAWHNLARDHGFKTYVSPAMQKHRQLAAAD